MSIKYSSRKETSCNKQQNHLPVGDRENVVGVCLCPRSKLRFWNIFQKPSLSNVLYYILDFGLFTQIFGGVGFT